MSAQDEQRLLAQNLLEIDVWSTQEKLALATGVTQNGDTNWPCLSRNLKSFENRPADFFNQKFCAIQYRDMLEKADATKKKRERKDRADETSTNLVIKKLHSERLDELTTSIREKIVQFCELKTRLDKLKQGNYDEKIFIETINLIRERQKKKQQEEIDHKKWVAERQIKINQMFRRFPKQFKNVIPIITETPTDGDSKISEDKDIEKDIPEQVVEKDTSLLSSLLQTATNASPKSPKPNLEQSEIKENEKQESVVGEQKEDIKEEVEVIQGVIVKVDTPDSDEIKSVSIEEIISEDSVSPMEILEDIKNEVIIEQENSNDTIEETLDETIPEPPPKDDAPISEVKNESPTISKDIPNAVISNVDKVMETEDSTNKELPEIKIEDESSTSIFETKNSTLDTTHEDNMNTPTESTKIRRRRRKSNKLGNTSVMQTRSTRSQSHIKAEEPKEISIKIEIPKIYSKKRSNSADETTSLDNTISEESNDAKSSNNESVQNEGVIDCKWKKAASGFVKQMLNDRNASYFTQPVSDSVENYRKVVRKEMDINLIKKRIHNGQTKNNIDLKRDILLMFSNVYMYNNPDDRVYKAAVDMANNYLPSLDLSEQKITRMRERTAQAEINMKSNRRKTRGSITLDNKTTSKKKN